MKSKPLLFSSYRLYLVFFLCYSPLVFNFSCIHFCFKREQREKILRLAVFEVKKNPSNQKKQTFFTSCCSFFSECESCNVAAAVLELGVRFFIYRKQKNTSRMNYVSFSIYHMHLFLYIDQHKLWLFMLYLSVSSRQFFS